MLTGVTNYKGGSRWVPLETPVWWFGEEIASKNNLEGRDSSKKTKRRRTGVSEKTNSLTQELACSQEPTFIQEWPLVTPAKYKDRDITTSVLGPANFEPR